MNILFLGFLCVAAWQDFRVKSISRGLFWLFGVTALFMMFFSEENRGMPDRLLSPLVGLGLLVVGVISRGGIGQGDGWFFVVSGLYLGWGQNMALLCSGILLCGVFSLGIMTWGIVRGISVRGMSLPFLPFLLPAGIWMVARWGG